VPKTEGRDVVARFHGGRLDGQLITDWPDPPGRSVWVERVEGGVVVTDDPAAAQAGEPDPDAAGYDHYALAEVVADLAVYHFAEPS
jgi:hypothetical protein